VYTVVLADAGHALTCTVIASNAGGPSSPVTSAAVNVPGAPAGGSASIAGTAAAGQTLTCQPAGFTNNPTSYSYQWNRDGTPITGATGQAYTVQSADTGHALTCTVVASNSSGSSAPVTSAAVNVPQSKPVNTVPPQVPTPAGGAVPGKTLNCSSGSWSNNPVRFTYQWARNGVPIPGATSSTYVVQIADEGSYLTCTVTAFNAAGSATSQPVLVAIPGTTNCPKPTGSLSGSKLGPLALGMSQTKARKLLHRFSVQNGFDNFCLFAGWGIRVAYPTTRSLRGVPPSLRQQFKGKIVLALTANPFYALNGVRPGATFTSAVAKRLHLGKPFKIGANSWYIVPGGAANGILKVRNGIVAEIGIVNKRLTSGGRKQQAQFLSNLQ
jgi:uncharacterized OB-fold protein